MEEKLTESQQFQKKLIELCKKFAVVLNRDSDDEWEFLGKDWSFLIDSQLERKIDEANKKTTDD